MRPKLFCDPAKSRVQQHFRQHCDINTIVAKARTTGLPQPKTAGMFGDFTNIDFEGMQNTVCKARQAFESLPAKIRSKFHNNPAELLEFISDENNYEQGVKLGICERRPSPPKEENTPVIPTPEPAKAGNQTVNT